MWPIGHVAGAYVLNSLYSRSRARDAPGGVAVLALGLGAVFPDIIDKPFAWYLGILPTGRSLSHSLLLILPLSLLLVAVGHRVGREEWGEAFAVGAISHLFFDALPVIWEEADIAFLLYPILGVEPYADGSPDVVEMFLDASSDPYFLFEFVLLGMALILWRRHGYPGWNLLVRGAPS